MRTMLLALCTLLATFTAGCGGSNDGLPPDTLDHDAASLFAGTWYGTAVATSAGSTQSSSMQQLDVAVTGRNLLMFKGMCGDGNGPAVRVTSDVSLGVGTYSCTIPGDNCTATWTVARGSGTLVDGQLSFSLDGTIGGCGVDTRSITIAFSGGRTPPGGPGPIGVDHGPPTVVLASTSVSTQPNVPVTLDASASSDPDGRWLSYSWSVTANPASAYVPTLGSSWTPQTTFTTAAEGSYVVQVTVTASDGQSASASVTVDVGSVSLPGEVIAALSHRVADAAYSRSLDRIVMTDGSPDALYVYDPATGAESSVALALPPQCLSVSPDGKHALVGHNAWISYVDLVAAKVEKTIPIAIDAGACAVGAGWAYVFPRTGYDEVHSIELATGVESGGWNPYMGSRGVLAPDGKTLYAVTASQSPMDLKRWDVSTGVAKFAYEMAYHGDYPVGDQVWIDRSGARIFTSAGTAFRTSSVQAQDMTYAGALSSLTSIAHLDSSTTEIAAIPRTSSWDPSSAASDTTVELFNTTYLGRVDRITLPRWAVGAKSYLTHGRFVFYSADGSKKRVVVQADAGSGLLLDTAVLTY
ncbi:MAG: PKD domain-containing protein [Anaeromyxobacteraceae bacterium]